MRGLLHAVDTLALRDRSHRKLGQLVPEEHRKQHSHCALQPDCRSLRLHQHTVRLVRSLLVASVVPFARHPAAALSLETCIEVARVSTPQTEDGSASVSTYLVSNTAMISDPGS